MVCRSCGKIINTDSLIVYSDMPGRAQYFFSKDELENDKGVDLKIYECEHCGLLQLDCKPVFYYRDVIRAAGVSEEMRLFRIDYFKQFIKDHGLSGKKILEIGCGNGEFMGFMKEAGGNVFGLEHSREAVEHCLMKGLNAFCGYPEGADYKIENSPYDAFYIMNFLEHIPDPGDFLSAIKNNLSDEAVGLIEVPNSNMIIKNSMFSEFMLDHISYFTEGTLRRLLEVNGFDVIKCEPVWHDYCLAAIVKVRKRTDFGSFRKKRDDLTKELNDLIDKYKKEEKKVAVWGAGHQALAVIAMAGIAERLEFVIDSADFKQNKYTPGTHCLVVSPDRLKTDPVSLTIVMAASYSDEVSRIIKKDHPGTDVAILRENKLEYQ